MSTPGTDDAIARARQHIERAARAQCTPGQIGASLWSAHILADRVEVQQMIRDLADDIVAWRLAGKADVKIAHYEGAVGRAKLSPGQAQAQVAWGTQHLGWTKREGSDPAKESQSEQRETAGATTLKVAG